MFKSPKNNAKLKRKNKLSLSVDNQSRDLNQSKDNISASTPLLDNYYRTPKSSMKINERNDCKDKCSTVILWKAFILFISLFGVLFAVVQLFELEWIKDFDSKTANSVAIIVLSCALFVCAFFFDFKSKTKKIKEDKSVNDIESQGLIIDDPKTKRLENEVLTLNKDKEEYRKKLDELDKEKDKIKGEYEDKINELNKLKDKIKDEYEARINEDHLEYEGKMKQLQAKLTNNQQEIDALNLKIEDYKHSEDISRNKIKGLLKENADLKKQLMKLLTTNKSTQSQFPDPNDISQILYSIQTTEHLNVKRALRLYIKKINTDKRWSNKYVSQCCHHFLFKILLKSNEVVKEHLNEIYIELSNILCMKAAYNINTNDDEKKDDIIAKKTLHPREQNTLEYMMYLYREEGFIVLLENKLGKQSLTNWNNDDTLVKRVYTKCLTDDNDHEFHLWPKLDNDSDNNPASISEDWNEVVDDLQNYIAKCLNVCWSLILTKPNDEENNAILQLFPNEFDIKNTKNNILSNNYITKSGINNNSNNETNEDNQMYKYEANKYNKSGSSDKNCSNILYCIWPTIAWISIDKSDNNKTKIDIVGENKIEIVLKDDFVPKQKPKKSP